MIPAAGSLDRRIHIQERIITRNQMGEPKEQFSIRYPNVPAALKPFTGREKFNVEAAREISYKQYRFVTRYISGLTAKHRIIFEGEVYDIVYLAEIPRRQGWDIYTQLAK